MTSFKTHSGKFNMFDRSSRFPRVIKAFNIFYLDP